MDLEFTSEQDALREGARELLAREWPAAAVREHVEKGRAPDQLWQAQVDTGWTAIALPETVGGLGLGAVELTVLAEESGRAVAPGPWLATATQYGALLSEVADADSASDLLPGVAEGAVRGALAVAEAPSGNPPDVVRSVAGRDGDGWRLRATKHVVVGAADATHLAVVAAVGAPSERDLGVFVVDADRAQLEPVPPVDRTRGWATVTLDGVAATPVGEPGTSGDGVRRGLEVAALALAAEIVGACSALLERTIEYAKQREQFGVPIGSFQAVKHKLADDFLVVQRARAAVYFAAMCVAEDDDRRGWAVAMAKAAAGDCEHRVAEDAIQTHGGIGYTWEHDVQLWVKRAKQNSGLLGTAGWHRARVADLLGLPTGRR